MTGFPASLFEKIRKTAAWWILLLLFIGIQWLASSSTRAEQLYANGLYPVISRIQRILFGWIPFSMGDLFYFGLGLWALIGLIRMFGKIRRRKFGKTEGGRLVRRLVFTLLLLYVAFYGCWGINYDRLGISYQLKLPLASYRTETLDSMTGELLSQLNRYSNQVTDSDRNFYARKKNVLREAVTAYQVAENIHPFLHYRSVSLKPSMYSYVGNVFGFSGYYNPFSGEAQVNTSIPPFLQPFVACHEIGHQLGYAKENEANFVAYLSGKEHPSAFFRYSVYFDMFQYTYAELYRADSSKAIHYREQLSPVVQADILALTQFYKKYENPIEPVISALYGGYLKANNQPEGKRSYNKVVSWLVAYRRKYGVKAM